MTATDPLDEDLFAGREPREGQAQALLEQYKLFVNTSEALVQRRQGVNTFFLSVNSLLLAAAGLIVRDGVFGGVESLILISLSVSGGVLCLVWRSLISSFRQLSTGKFKVIHALEQRLPARIFSAEWVALGEGRDPNIYKPFTGTESKTPIAFLVLHFVLLVAGAWGALPSLAS